MATGNLPKENRDPISGATGAHPVGTGVGAVVGGAAAGAAAGTVVGPVGTAVGAAVGAVVGGLAGKGIGEKINPTIEEAHWRETYTSRPYVDRAKTYDHYAPAYRYGWESRSKMPNASWDESEVALRRDWETHPHSWTLDWNSASHAIRDAWERGDDVNRRDDVVQPGMTQSAANG
jgi:phage tail tape-measure protein